MPTIRAPPPPTSTRALTLAEQFRHAAALALVERGLALAVAQETRFALLMARGRLLVELGRPGDAIEAARAALEAASNAGERARALIAMAAGMRLNDRIAEGLAALDEAEPLATASALALDLSRLHHLRGNLLFPLGRDADCVREHELARRLARDAGSLEAEAAAMGGLGDGYYLQGRMRSANRQFQACVALARANGFGRLEVANLSMIGWTGMHLTEFSAAAAAVGHEAIELALRASQPRAEIMARSLVACGRRPLPRPARRGRAAVRGGARARANALGAKRFEAQALGVRAMLALRDGERERARQLVDEGLALCRVHGMGHIGPWLHGVRALDRRPTRDARRAGSTKASGSSRSAASATTTSSCARSRSTPCSRSATSTASSATASRIERYTAQEPLPMSECDRRARPRPRARRARRAWRRAGCDAAGACATRGPEPRCSPSCRPLDAAIAQVASASPS